ncbi:MAG: peptidoglycan editing factor PgeF [Sneathiella sp.]|nr:peptidoglycan editing factor PgeF [Sneathiella sp.]
MITSPVLDNTHAKHAFFTRENGVSDGIYKGLNCGAGSNDKPENVKENKRRAAKILGVSLEKLATVHQVHSADVITVDNDTTLETRVKADAMVSKTPGIALGILTADCVPILFVDPSNKVIGAAHSGWKGSVANIGANVIDAMIDLGAQRENICAAIGPAIQQSSYEVGPEFNAPFLELDAENRRFFKPSARHGHHMFDLTGFVKQQLETENIHAVDLIDRDTCSDDHLFFSYRRMTHMKEADYGRQLSAITLQG